MPEAAAAEVIAPEIGALFGGLSEAGAGAAAVEAGTAGAAAAEGLSGVAAVEAAPAGSIRMGLNATEIAGSAFAPAAAAGAAGTAISPGTIPPPSAPGPASGGVLDSLKTAATVLGPVASLISASSALAAGQQARKAAGQSILGTPAPTLQSPAAMPTFGSTPTLAAERRSIVEQVQRRGRASTVLTNPASDGDRLGS